MNKPNILDEQPYPYALQSVGKGKCFWCGKATYWIDIDYGDYLCSQRCSLEIEADVKRRQVYGEAKVRTKAGL